MPLHMSKKTWPIKLLGVSTQLSSLDNSCVKAPAFCAQIFVIETKEMSIDISSKPIAGERAPSAIPVFEPKIANYILSVS